MLFNSLVFLIFAACFFLVWPLVRRAPTVRLATILVASAVFYGWWNPLYLLLILASGLIDFFAALAMTRFPRARAALLALSVLANLGTLAAFKYADFFIESVNSFATQLGMEAGLTPLHLVLPVGISFYTFQSMSYTIDVYRGELEATRNPLVFFTYLSMFPQLVAGPIVRASDLLSQLTEEPIVTSEDAWHGLSLVARGFFLKTVVADNMAPAVNWAFGAGFAESEVGGVAWLLIAVMFAFQIFCDFAGYSFIAIGLARWMGYRFPDNFNHPYIATSLREFWSRWHISLSTWFRDYVYKPLGGSRRGRFRTHVNLWITMLLSGLWHGAAWTFVLWGALHAAFQSFERETRWPERLEKSRASMVLAASIVFAQVLIGWVFFRAESASQAFAILGSLARLQESKMGSGFWASGGMRALAALAAAAVGEFCVFSIRKLDIGRVPQRGTLAAFGVALAIVASIYFRGPGSQFVYFQF